jgi:hypothetical protein
MCSKYYDDCAQILSGTHSALAKPGGAQDVFDSGSLVTTSLKPIGRRDSRRMEKSIYCFYFESCALACPGEPSEELAELGTTTRHRRNPVMDLVTLDLPAGRKQPSCYRPPRDVGGRRAVPESSPTTLPSEPASMNASTASSVHDE